MNAETMNTGEAHIVSRALEQPFVAAG